MTVNTPHKFKMRVMLIDDDDAAHTYHKILMGDAGFDLELVEVFISVDTAISELARRAEEQRKDLWPEAILLDINMPKKTGWDFIKDFKSLAEDFPFPAIYLVSNSDDKQDRLRAQSMPEVVDLHTKFLQADFFDGLKKKQLAS